MYDEQLHADIRDANLTYLILAQNLIRRDKSEALFRLGITDDSATLIATLSPAQILKLSATSMLLCKFRIEDEMTWSLLTNRNTGKVNNDAATKLHASVLLSGQLAETA